MQLRTVPLRALIFCDEHDTADGASRCPHQRKISKYSFALEVQRFARRLGGFGAWVRALHLGFEDWGLGFTILSRILETLTTGVGICVWGSRFGDKTS